MDGGGGLGAVSIGIPEIVVALVVVLLIAMGVWKLWTIFGAAG